MARLAALLAVAILLCRPCLAGEAVRPPAPRFAADGSFKILQLTDIHFQPEAGPTHAATYDGYVSRILDAEKPQLVVITGDFLYWSRQPVEAYFEGALAPVVDRKIPWAVTLGNHEYESYWTPREIMTYLESRPFSLARRGPPSLGSSSDYTVTILSAETPRPAAVLFLLDSHSRHPRAVDCTRPTSEVALQLVESEAKPDFGVLRSKHGTKAMAAFHAIGGLTVAQMVEALTVGLDLAVEPGFTIRVARDDFVPVDTVAAGYDYLSVEQVMWYRERSASLRRDLGGPLPALMFFHIPVPEFAEVRDFVGARGEPASVQKKNTGMFDAILAQGDVMGVFVGHDHLNDFVALRDGVALAYGRKSGMGAYGPPVDDLGGRVILLREGQRRFETWIRTAQGLMVDRITVPDALLPWPAGRDRPTNSPIGPLPSSLWMGRE